MMNDAYYYLALVGFVLAGISLIVTVVLFFALDISHILGERSESLGRAQVAEIRAMNLDKVQQNRKINVFEEMEKRAKIGKTVDRAEPIPSQQPVRSGTSVLQQPVEVIDPNFIMEKNIVFVYTDEVI